MGVCSLWLGLDVLMCFLVYCLLSAGARQLCSLPALFADILIYFFELTVFVFVWN